jgi:hypothetical protein
MVRARTLTTKMARSIVRKAGVRPGDFTDTTTLGSGALVILSVGGSAMGTVACPIELQTLIDAFEADPTPANREALIDYIEDELGQSIAEAYPEEWEAVQNGEQRTIRIDLGTYVVELTLSQGEGGVVSDSVMGAVCVADVPIPPWPGTTIACSLELQELIDAFQTELEEQG